MNKYMKLALEESMKNKENNFQKGGPFGALIVKNDKIIAASHNTVRESQDPTAHAEINAIRKACQILKTHDLSECVLYTSCFPCPMCLSASVWAGIKTIYYGNTKEDADNIGFRDDKIYRLLNNLSNNNELKLINIDREETIKAFEIFNKDNLY